MNPPDEKTALTKAPSPSRSSGRGQKPMILVSGAVLLTLALINESRATEKHGALWPVLVAILAFLYLWWLSSLLFDLLFVWHRYIQGDAAHKFLRQHVRRKDLSPEGDLPPERPISGDPAKLPPEPPGSGISFGFEATTEKPETREAQEA